MAMKKFVKFLKGKGNLNKLILNIDLFTKNLERQRRKLMAESRKNFERAREYRLEGEDESAKLYLEHYIRNKKMALGVDRYRLNIVNLLNQLKQGQAHNQTALALMSIQENLIGMKTNLELPTLEALMSGITQTFEQFKLSGELMHSKMEEQQKVDTQISDDEIHSAFAELDADIGLETGINLAKPVDGKVSKLEEEIKKLREDK
ncbi:MAG: Snf7 family protein [Candidatus Helarchaeota archaeon]